MLQATRNKWFTLSTFTSFSVNRGLALRSKATKGFTLIELLVVIGIMGTLITLLLPNFIGGRQRSKDAKRKLDVEQIASALEQYRSVAGVYPSSITHNCDATKETLTYDSGSAGIVTFLSTVPQDPGCSTYVYYSTMSSTDYTVCAYLEATTSTTAASNTDCLDGVSSQACNYCKGPYGTK